MGLFEHYVQKGRQKLRLGFTTGSCAALAAKAATEMLLSGEHKATVGIVTPKGIAVKVPVLKAERTAACARCAVRKDAGDDPDVTDGVLVYAGVCKAAGPGIRIDGGRGVGRVTRPGLDQPVGAAAINCVPRRMIAAEAQAICERYAYGGGLAVTISIPRGVELARRTFNSGLGIEGGISVLGTSGIVEPMSTQAFLDSLALELRVLAAEGHKDVIFTPGNYGKKYVAADTKLAAATVPLVKCSNYIGEVLDFAVSSSFERILLVGHLGKLVKLAGGIMNTHSSTADCRRELLAAHAALAGAGRDVVAELMQAASTEACVGILEKCALRPAVLLSLLQNIQRHLVRRAGEEVTVGAVLFSNAHGYLGQTGTAAGLIASFCSQT